MNRTLEERKQLLALLKTAKLSEYPHFDCYEDGSGEIYLDQQALFNMDYMKRLIEFCEANKLSFQLFTREIDSRNVGSNKILIALHDMEA